MNECVSEYDIMSSEKCLYVCVSSLSVSEIGDLAEDVAYQTQAVLIGCGWRLTCSLCTRVLSACECRHES